MMQYILCYNCHVNAYNPKTLTRKGLILYDKKNGIFFFNKHVNENHAIIEKKFGEKVNSPLKETI
jgi:hypothetical protein